MARTLATSRRKRLASAVQGAAVLVLLAALPGGFGKGGADALEDVDEAVGGAGGILAQVGVVDEHERLLKEADHVGVAGRGGQRTEAQTCEQRTHWRSCS